MLGKNCAHVALQHVAKACGRTLAAVQRAVRALADPVGVRVRDKARAHSGSITRTRAWCTTRSRKGAAEIRRRLGSWMAEIGDSPRLIGSLLQRILQGKQLFFLTALKLRYR